MKLRKLIPIIAISLFFLTGIFAAAPYEVVLAFPVFKMPANVHEVQVEMNKITLAKINTKVKLLPVNFADYQTKLNLALAGNENWDLVSNGTNFQYTNQVSRDQLLPLDELIDQYGQDYIACTEEIFRAAGKIQGKTYITINLRPMGANYGICMRKDLCDKYNIDYTKIKTLSDVYDVLKIIKANEPDIIPTSPQLVNTTMVTFCRTTDRLGALDGAVLPNFGSTLKVTNYYQSKEYETYVKTFYKWYQEGLIKQDIATEKEPIVNLSRSGQLFSYFTNMKPGFETQETNANGHEMVVAELFPAMATTTDVIGFGWSIPRNCKDPVSTMKLLNLLCADSKLSSLVINGIEGKHYQYVSGMNNTIEYPAGYPENSDYFFGTIMGWLFPNQGITPVWIGNPENFWDEFKEFNMNARRSKAMGFTFDAAPVKSEITAVTNVINQYQMTLENGAVNPDKVLPEFRKKLKAAGIDKIVAEKQKQLNDWVKENKIK